MCDCPGCGRRDRQIAAMEAKLKLQAQEWQRITGECDELRRQVAKHERAEMRRAHRRAYKASRSRSATHRAHRRRA